MTAVESQQLIDSAHDFVPELRERSVEIDNLRQLPQDLAHRLAAAGFYRMCAPAGLGGTGTGPVTSAEVCEILGTGNGSVAWCTFIGATSQYTFVGLADAQLEEMLATPDIITSGVFASTGRARSEERDGAAGYLVDGTWTWGSGCHNAEWISGGVLIERDGETIDARAYFRPDELDIEDNWHTSGLRGSGSSTYHAHGVWVPERRLTDPVRRSEFATDPVYRFPQFATLCIPIGALCLGMAQSSIDEVLRIAEEKTPTGSRRTLAHRPALHRDVAVADTKLRAARALLYDTVGEVWALVQGESPTLEHRRVLRTAVAHATSTAVEVIDKMYTVVGGSSIFQDSCLQRNLRDVHVATQHMMVAEPVFELAGRVMLGLDDKGIGL